MVRALSCVNPAALCGHGVLRMYAEVAYSTGAGWLVVSESNFEGLRLAQHEVFYRKPGRTAQPEVQGFSSHVVSKRIL
jgi:hypothetical protein